MDIRKISIGSDYKSGAMHYIVGQEVLGGSHTIHLIQGSERSYKIWIQRNDEITSNRAESTEMSTRCKTEQGRWYKDIQTIIHRMLQNDDNVQHSNDDTQNVT